LNLILDIENEKYPKIPEVNESPRSIESNESSQESTKILKYFFKNNLFYHLAALIFPLIKNLSLEAMSLSFLRITTGMIITRNPPKQSLLTPKK